MSKSIRTFFTAALAVGCCLTAMADTVRLAGSPSMVNSVVNPGRSAVEQATGHSLELSTNGSGKGLLDLAEGRTDIAMVSYGLDLAAGVLESETGKRIDISKMRLHEIRKGEVVFVTHATNPVGKLSWSQLGDIFAGRISNWKQVGGSDKPIVVYLGPKISGSRATVKKVLMAGSDYSDGARTVTSTSRVAEVVAADEAGIGIASRLLIKADAKTRIIDTARIETPLAMVTLGEPSGKIKQVIEAYKTAAR